MARKLSAKQIKAGFGGKRRQTALKQNRRRTRRAAATHHRPRATANKSKRAPRPRTRTAATHRNTAMGYRGSGGWRKATGQSKPISAGSKPARKRNLGSILALTGNPAKKGHTMARPKKKRRAASSHRAGYTQNKRRKPNPGHRRSQRNPGVFGSPIQWLEGGAGVLTGVVAARGLPQLLMGSSNTGPVGYFYNAIATGLATFAAHMAFPRRPVFTGSVLAGGVAAIMSRIIGDYSLLGSSLSSQVGLGDYLFNFNFPIPQYLTPGNTKSLTPAGGAPMATLPTVAHSAVAAGMAPAGVSGYGRNLY